MPLTRTHKGQRQSDPRGVEFVDTVVVRRANDVPVDGRLARRFTAGPSCMCTRFKAPAPLDASRRSCNPDATSDFRDRFASDTISREELNMPRFNSRQSLLAMLAFAAPILAASGPRLAAEEGASIPDFSSHDAAWVFGNTDYIAIPGEPSPTQNDPAHPSVNN